MIGIVFLLNTSYAPYLEKYTKILEEENEDFEVIYWDRLGIPSTNDNYKTRVYKKESKLNTPISKKFIEMLGFRKFVIKTVNKNTYDKLIILTTLTGVFLFDFLRKEYTNKYIFDIRDYTFEKINTYKKIEEVVIKNSFFTTISSEKFNSFLPIKQKHKYITSHNLIREEISEASNFTRSKNNKIINLTFIGAVRHFDIDTKIALKMANDERFQVVYHGYGVSLDRFRDFCIKNSLDVQFTGRYNRVDKMKLLSNTNIINAYYNDNNFANLFAMPNKYYDSLIYKIPFWANPNVYSGKRAIEAGIGINADLNSENFPRNLYEEYENINWKEFEYNCEVELSKIIAEDDYFIMKVKEFIYF